MIPASTIGTPIHPQGTEVVTDEDTDAPQDTTVVTDGDVVTPTT